jgi:hypothetical protein
VLALLLVSGAAHARDALGVPLPYSAKELGENRFKSSLDVPSTVKWLKRQLRKKGVRVRFRKTIDLPDVVSYHAESPRSRTRWSGINVSEYGGSVVIYVIERP